MELKSILTDDFEHCYICGSQAQQWHHIFNKYDKKRSEKFGLLIPLCARCHMKIHDSDEATNKIIKRTAQMKFELIHSKEEWMKEFGKNYI